MLDDFLDKQALAYSLLKKSLSSEKIFHAYLINGNNYENSYDFALALAKSIICSFHKTSCDNCLDCHICERIDNGNFSELKIIESDSMVIKKEQLLELQNDFSKSSLEGKYRVYIIKDCEKMNKYASNSLLKFLEEPHDGIVAILLTNRFSGLLSTIVSRCQVINLVNDFEYGKSNSLINFIRLCSDNQGNITDSFIDDNYSSFIYNVLNFILYFEENGLDTLVYMKNLWYNNFKLRDEVLNAFLLMVYFYYDVLKFKLNTCNYFYSDRVSDIEYVANLNSVDNIIHKINVCSYGYEMVKSNLNVNLLMDDIVIKLGDLCGKVVEVSFGNSNNSGYFRNNGLILKNNLTVIVDTDRGYQFGKIVNIISDGSKFDDVDLYDVIRISRKNDYHKYLENVKLEEEALNRCRDIVLSEGLNMSILDASYNFDRSQLLFRFVADERIDFRKLARDLGGLFHARIELRQIGIRDKAKEIGGIGPCGRLLCCSSFLNSFDSVTINMAKNQNVSLNPTKINGVCGRLLCCLKYENDIYTDLKKGFPKVGSKVIIDDKEGKVVSLNVLNRNYIVEFEDKTKIEVDVDEIKNRLLNYNMIIYQDDDWFKFSLDSVLLANFVTINLKHKKIMDFCTGNAPIPMLLTNRTKSVIYGVELQKNVYELGLESIRDNKLDKQIFLVNDDVKKMSNYFESDSFDVITCNPPYFRVKDGCFVNDNSVKAIARHEINLNMDELLNSAFYLLKNGGYFAMVHRTERFIEVVELFRKYNIEPKRIRFIYPKFGKSSDLFLIEGIKNGKVGLKMLNPIIVHKEDNSYTEFISNLLNKC